MAEEHGTPEVLDDLGQYLKSAAPITHRETFGSGAHAFDVEFRRIDKRVAEQLFKTGRRRTRDAKGEWREDFDPEPFRYFLAEKGLVGWHGLTLAKVLRLTNRDPAQLNGSGQVAVNFSVENAVELMRTARGIVEGEPMALEDWILRRVTEIADRAASEDAAGKNA